MDVGTVLKKGKYFHSCFGECYVNDETLLRKDQEPFTSTFVKFKDESKVTEVSLSNLYRTKEEAEWSKMPDEERKARLFASKNNLNEESLNELLNLVESIREQAYAEGQNSIYNSEY